MRPVRTCETFKTPSASLNGEQYGTTCRNWQEENTAYCAVAKYEQYGITYRMDNKDKVQDQLKAFGANLRRARVSCGLTQEALAECANLNIRTLQKFEAGQSNVLITTAMRLRAGIGCSWEELLDPP